MRVAILAILTLMATSCAVDQALDSFVQAPVPADVQFDTGEPLLDPEGDTAATAVAVPSTNALDSLPEVSSLATDSADAPSGVFAASEDRTHLPEVEIELSRSAPLTDPNALTDGNQREFVDTQASGPVGTTNIDDPASISSDAELVRPIYEPGGFSADVEQVNLKLVDSAIDLGGGIENHSEVAARSGSVNSTVGSGILSGGRPWDETWSIQDYFQFAFGPAPFTELDLIWAGVLGFLAALLLWLIFPVLAWPIISIYRLIVPEKTKKSGKQYVLRLTDGTEGDIGLHTDTVDELGLTAGRGASITNSRGRSETQIIRRRTRDGFDLNDLEINKSLRSKLFKDKDDGDSVIVNFKERTLTPLDYFWKNPNLAQRFANRVSVYLTGLVFTLEVTIGLFSDYIRSFLWDFGVWFLEPLIQALIF